MSLPSWAHVVEEISLAEMDAGKIPGLAVTLVHGAETLVEGGYGVADAAARRPVDVTTGFELASNSKAMTGLAVLRLSEERGLSLDAPIDRFVPWLDLRWRGGRVFPTVRDFLHHTSGVPEHAVAELRSHAGETAIEATLRDLLPVELAHAPGETLEYSSVNYDVLGLVIEAWSQRPFADVVASEVFGPAGLSGTAFRSAAFTPDHTAQGYKLAFWGAHPFDPPPFDGNAPAAYVVSTAGDMGRWLKLQLGASDAPSSLAELVRRSHEASAAARGPEGRYAVGWFVEADGALVHEGANPSYSSFVAFDGASGYGVAVLANLNSEHTYHAGRRILETARSREAIACSGRDEMATVDTLASGATVACAAGAGAVLVGASRLGRPRAARRSLTRRGAAAGALVLAAYVAAVVAAPAVLSGNPWRAIRVWAPLSVVAATASAVALGGVVALAAVRRRVRVIREEAQDE